MALIPHKTGIPQNTNPPKQQQPEPQKIQKVETPTPAKTVTETVKSAPVKNKKKLGK